MNPRTKELLEKIDDVIGEENLVEFSMFGNAIVYGIFLKDGTQYKSGIQKNKKNVKVTAWETTEDAEYVANLINLRKGEYEVRAITSKGQHVYKGTFGMRGRV
jgi:hypothetical protein